MTDKNIVANTSKAYGYNYASLGDIALQGFKIPKMKTGTENLKEYVYYYDEEIKEWIRGAEIVVPENIVSRDGKNKMNSAQLYGSALTYARRYTTLMALSLVCDEDKKLEAQEPMEEKPSSQKNVQAQNSAMWEGLKEDLSIKDLADEFRRLYTQEEQDRILNGLGYKRAEEIGAINLQKYNNYIKYGKKQTNQG